MPNWQPNRSDVVWDWGAANDAANELERAAGLLDELTARRRRAASAATATSSTATWTRCCAAPVNWPTRCAARPGKFAAPPTAPVTNKTSVSANAIAGNRKGGKKSAASGKNASGANANSAIDDQHQQPHDESTTNEQ